MTNLDSIFKSRDITLPTEVRLVKAIVFQWSWMRELDCEEGWASKNWCFWTVVLEKTLESPLDCKEIQPVHSEGDQPWDFFGRNDAKAETPVLWPPHGKSWLIGKDFDAGKDWGQEEKGTTEDEKAGWHHGLDESEWTPGVGDGQGGLVCCDSWGHKESDTTGQLKWLTDWLTDVWTGDGIQAVLRGKGSFSYCLIYVYKEWERCSYQCLFIHRIFLNVHTRNWMSTASKYGALKVRVGGKTELLLCRVFLNFFGKRILHIQFPKDYRVI